MIFFVIRRNIIIQLKIIKKKGCQIVLILLKKEVTDESRDPMNILKVVSSNIKRSYSWQGITEATGG